MRRHSLLSALVAIALLTVLSNACSIQSESKPRPLSRDQFPLILDPGANSTTTIPPTQGKRGWVCFVQQRSKNGPKILSCVSRKLKSISPDSLFEALVAGPDIQERNIGGLSTAIPQKVKLLGVKPVTATGVLSINLSNEINSVSSPNDTIAYYQIVRTLTDPRNGLDADAITVRVDGEPRKIPTDDGPKAVATVNDFDPMVATSQSS